MFPPDCTLVTACYDLSKYNNKSRNKEEAMNNMRSLLATHCYLVIFTDALLHSSIKEVRDSYNLDHLTKYIVKEFDELNISKYVDQVKSNRAKYHPTHDERTCAESHLICCSKFDFVLEVIEQNPFQTPNFGWIDSNIGPNFSKICTNYKNNMLLRALDHTMTDKFHIQILNVTDKKYTDVEHLAEYYQQYRWVVCGSFFTTGRDVGVKILTDLNAAFVKHTNAGVGHGEEMLYLEILDKHYDSIQRTFGDYRTILNNFVSVTEYIPYIHECIIRGNLSRGYNRESLECCLAVLSAYDKFELELDYSRYFLILFDAYISAHYCDEPLARKIVQKIDTLIAVNPHIFFEYKKNQGYYDQQLSCIR
jgi:hypothetical protein